MSASRDQDLPVRVASAEVRARAERPRSRVNKDQLFSIALVTPSIIAIAIFVYGFIGWSVRVSVSAWRGLLPDYTYVRLEQYAQLLRDRRFGIDVRNTVIFTVLFLIACLVIGLFLAILLDQRLRGEAFFRSVFLFPMAISFIVTGVVWRWLMNAATGSRISGLNLLFSRLGLDFLISQWHLTQRITIHLPFTLKLLPFSEFAFALAPNDWVIQGVGIAFVVIPAVWQMSGFTMALYLGGLRSIPDDLREAARVDGASEFQIYRHIILPLLQPVTLSAVIILGHISLKIFDLIVAISQNNIQLDVPAVYMWRTTFDGQQYGQGAAIGIIMLVTVALLIIPYLVYSMRTEAEV